MDNRNQITDENLGRNLGMTLIQWMRMMNAKKQNRQSGSVNTYNNRGLESRQYPDLLSVKVKNTASGRNTKNNFRGE
jgi:hypothetical protein